VSRVIDGQSIEISINNTLYQVRYIGVSAPGVTPEIEWQGPQAIAFNSDLVSGKFVILVKDVSETDREGFLLRYVIVDDIFVNYELIRKGYGRALIVTPDVACATPFLAAQSEAQSALLGVWSPTPLPSSTATSTPTQTRIPTNTRLPTSTLPPPCSCSQRYTCNDFTRQADAQACYEYCGPGVGLIDKSNNGRVCEGLP
jgi:endonuclease YncB( thermonuclease family)